MTSPLHRILATALLSMCLHTAAAQQSEYYLLCAKDPITQKSYSKAACAEQFNQRLYDFYNLYPYYQLAGGIEVSVNNPAYTKVWLENNAVAAYANTTFSTGAFTTPTRKTNGNASYYYLYRAYAELAPDAQGRKKTQLLLFYSHYNIGNNGDKKPAFYKEVAQDITNNPIVLAELDTDIYTEVYAYANSTVGGLQKAYATTTYLYEPSTLIPGKQPVLIGKKYEYKMHVLARFAYDRATQVNLKKEIATELIDYFQKDGGAFRYQVQRVEKLNEAQQPVEVRFDFYTHTKSPALNRWHHVREFALGYDIAKDSVFFITTIIKPFAIKWPVPGHLLEPNLLHDIRQHTGSDPIEDKELLREFLVDFKKLNEYIILDEQDIVENQPKKYIYKGTLKNGIPHGWGFLYAFNPFREDEYYLGHFSEGKPDGFGIRYNFKLDKASNLFSKGMHSGNRFIYGISGVSAESANIAYGDFRDGQLQGIGFKIYTLNAETGNGTIWSGSFNEGVLQGEGAEYSMTESSVGTYENGKLVSGNVSKDRMLDDSFSPGKVIRFEGKRYVIMKKENGNILLDDGRTITTRAAITLTGETSVRRQVCQICHGKGYFTETTTNTYAGTTTKRKTYETGPSGYIVWEKTTTTTTAPTTITSVKTHKCSCYSGFLESKPVPLQNR